MALPGVERRGSDPSGQPFPSEERCGSVPAQGRYSMMEAHRDADRLPQCSPSFGKSAAELYPLRVALAWVGALVDRFLRYAVIIYWFVIILLLPLLLFEYFKPTALKVATTVVQHALELSYLFISVIMFCSVGSMSAGALSETFYRVLMIMMSALTAMVGGTFSFLQRHTRDTFLFRLAACCITREELSPRGYSDTVTVATCGKLQISGVSEFVPSDFTPNMEEERRPGTSRSRSPPRRRPGGGGGGSDPPAGGIPGPGGGFLGRRCTVPCGYQFPSCTRWCMCWPSGHRPWRPETPHTCHACTLSDPEMLGGPDGDGWYEDRDEAPPRESAPSRFASSRGRAWQQPSDSRASGGQRGASGPRCGEDGAGDPLPLPLMSPSVSAPSLTCSAPASPTAAQLESWWPGPACTGLAGDDGMSPPLGPRPCCRGGLRTRRDTMQVNENIAAVNSLAGFPASASDAATAKAKAAGKGKDVPGGGGDR